MKEYLKQIRTHIAYSAFFSFFINMLQLTFSIYMLAIYDRVLPSYSMPTLATLTTMALFAMVIFGVLSFLRSRILIHAGNWLENRLNDKLLRTMIEECRQPTEDRSGGRFERFEHRSQLSIGITYHGAV